MAQTIYLPHHTLFNIQDGRTRISPLSLQQHAYVLALCLVSGSTRYTRCVDVESESWEGEVIENANGAGLAVLDMKRSCSDVRNIDYASREDETLIL